MGLVIPDELLMAAGMTEEELKCEIALMLYQQGRITLAQASRFAGMTRLQFQHLLASRRIPVHYDASDLEEDLKTMKEMKRP